MEKYIPAAIMPNNYINMIYMQHCVSQKKLEALSAAYVNMDIEWQYYKWAVKHPILNKIPFIKRYIRKKIGL